MNQKQSQIIFPAIDLRGGHVVRLKEGDPARQTTFATDPVAVGEQWRAAGAAWLHVVNLDGAFAEAGKKLWSNPARLMEANLQLWQDHMKLWQNASQAMLTGDKPEPVAAPERGDRRFRQPGVGNRSHFRC